MKTNFGFVRVAAAVPTMRVADCRYNAEQIKLQIDEAITEGVEVICFPELSITGYSCADLFFTQALQLSSMRELESICDYTRGKAIIVLVGAPLQVDNDLFNCAFVMTDGEVMGVVPKVNLPNTGEFYEKRWFTSGRAAREYTPGGIAPKIPKIFHAISYSGSGDHLQPLVVQLHHRQAYLPPPDAQTAEFARALRICLYFVRCGRIDDRCRFLRQHVYR